MLIVFCYLGWHSWELKKGGHRVCKRCGKRQTFIRVGDESGWH